PDGTALRGLIQKNPNWDRYNTQMVSRLTDIGETNTGDPAVLRDFIVWSARNYPAEAYALVIWNHGSGWKPDFIYEAAAKSAGPAAAKGMRAVDFASLYRRKTDRLLFRRTLEERIDSFIHNSLLPQLNVAAEPLRVDPRTTHSAKLRALNTLANGNPK